MSNIRIKINASKILKEHLYAGKNGLYLDAIAFENRDGPDQYGNTHFVCQSVSKADREAGKRGPIIGNLRVMDAPPPQPADDVQTDTTTATNDGLPF